MALAGLKDTNFPQNSLYIQVPLDLTHVYTAGDVVRGVVRCDPTSQPQRVSITFRGFCTIYDRGQEPMGIKLLHEKKDLFVSSGTGENHDILRRSPSAEDGKVEFPFEFTFPRNVHQSPSSDRQWWHSKDSRDHPRFQHSPGFLLPPSCTPPPALAPHITYFLEARMDSNMVIRRELKYIPPAPEYNLSLLQPNLQFGSGLPAHSCRYKFIRTRKLLPDYKEKNSSLHRVKDYLVEKELFFGIESFGEIPFVRFNIYTTPPRVAVIGSELPIQVRVQHLERSSSIPQPPQIFLRRVRVRLISNYDMFVPLPIPVRAPEHIERTQHVITLVDKKFDSKKGEPLIDGQDLGKILDLRLPKTDDSIIPSFTSYGLTLEHELQIDIWGECGSNDFSDMTCKVSIQVMSGWTVGHMEEDAPDGTVRVEAPPPSEFPPPPYKMPS